MPRLVDSAYSIVFVKTKAEVAKIIEEWRGEKSIKGFADILCMSPENCRHVLMGESYPNYQTISVLRARGYDIKKLFDLTDIEKEQIKSGNYDK